MKSATEIPNRPLHIERRILYLRDRKVMLDSDLATLYGVSTKVFLQAVRRNQSRFPDDFMFQLDSAEWEALRSQLVTSNGGRGGRRYAPFAFTELGVAMLSSVLGSAQAIAVNIEIMRAFVRLREEVASNADVIRRLEELENKSGLMSMKQDMFEDKTRMQLRQIFDALREMMTRPEPKKRPIGFVTPDETPGREKGDQAGTARR